MHISIVQQIVDKKSRAELPGNKRLNSMDGSEPTHYPIDGVLDLHTFDPSEVKNLVPDYISECLKKRIYLIRIIHGKGRGVLRNKVRSILDRSPHVHSFRTALEEEGGWGATIVRLKEK